MADISPNFSCSDPDLSHEFLTEEVWMINSEGPSHEYSITAIAVVQILFVIIGAPWNAFVIASIFFRRKFKEPTYILLLNLVISDFLVCSFVLPFNIASAIPRAFTIGNSDYTRCQVCQMSIVIIISLIYVSLFSLSLMSVDRLIYIKWPLHYSTVVTVPRVFLVVFIVWVFSLLVSVPPVFGFGEIKFANAVGSCSLIFFGESRLTSNIYYVIFLVIVGTFPFILTVVVNIWLLAIVCKTIHKRFDKKINHNNLRFDNTLERRASQQQIEGDYHKRQIRIAKVFGAIFGANVIIWISTTFISIITVALSSDKVPAPVLAVIFLAFLSQPAIHPMLETCLVGKARSVVLKCLCCCKRNKRDVDSVSVPSTRKPSSESAHSTTNFIVP